MASKALHALVYECGIPALAVVAAAAILSSRLRAKVWLARFLLAAAILASWFVTFGDVRPWVDSNHAVAWGMAAGFLFPFAPAVALVSSGTLLMLLGPLVEDWGWAGVGGIAAAGGLLALAAARPWPASRLWFIADAAFGAAVVGLLGASASLRLAESAVPLIAVFAVAAVWSGRADSSATLLAQSLRGARWIGTVALLAGANAYGGDPLPFASAAPILVLVAVGLAGARLSQRSVDVGAPPSKAAHPAAT